MKHVNRSGTHQAIRVYWYKNLYLYIYWIYKCGLCTLQKLKSSKIMLEFRLITFQSMIFHIFLTIKYYSKSLQLHQVLQRLKILNLMELFLVFQACALKVGACIEGHFDWLSSRFHGVITALSSICFRRYCCSHQIWQPLTVLVKYLPLIKSLYLDSVWPDLAQLLNMRRKEMMKNSMSNSNMFEYALGSHTGRHTDSMMISC